MRDNGDDVFGNPLPRIDRPVHVLTSWTHSSTVSTSTPSGSTLPSSLTLHTTSSSSSTTPLDAFIQSVHQALASGLSKETLIANIYLISDERSGDRQPPSNDDDFLSQ